MCYALIVLHFNEPVAFAQWGVRLSHRGSSCDMSLKYATLCSIFAYILVFVHSEQQ